MPLFSPHLAAAELVQCQKAPDAECNPAGCTSPSRCGRLYSCPHALLLLSRLPGQQYAALLVRAAASVVEYIFCPIAGRMIVQPNKRPLPANYDDTDWKISVN